MAIGKAGVTIDIKKFSIKFGDLIIIKNGKLDENYKEEQIADYMKNNNIDISIDISNGSKNFTAYTMDLTKNILKLMQIIEVNYIEFLKIIIK